MAGGAYGEGDLCDSKIELTPNRKVLSPMALERPNVGRKAIQLKLARSGYATIYRELLG